VNIRPAHQPLLLDLEVKTSAPELSLDEAASATPVVNLDDDLPDQRPILVSNSLARRLDSRPCRE